MSQCNSTVLSFIPPGFLECEAHQLHEILDGPTLINLQGEKAEPLFLCTLLHGNETTGLKSVQRVLREYGTTTLPRSISLFIGNVAAARYGERHLPSQQDYNRVWLPGDGDENSMTQSVIANMAQRDVFACIDIHNNTGRNPHYAIVATQEDAHIALAKSFSSRVVYATFPDGSCSTAFSKWCPSITIEAGVVGDAIGVDHVSTYLRSCIVSDAWLNNTSESFALYHTVAVVKIEESCSIGMLGEDADIELLPDVDRFNFNWLRPGTQLGRVRNGHTSCLRVEGADNSIAVSDYLSTERGVLRTVKPIMPAMLTTDCEIVKMDCLCYLMERLR